MCVFISNMLWSSVQKYWCCICPGLETARKEDELKIHLLEAHKNSIDAHQTIEVLLSASFYPSTPTMEIKVQRLMELGRQPNGKGKCSKRNAPADPMLRVKKRVKFDDDDDSVVVTCVKLETVSTVNEAGAVDVIIKEEVAEDVSARSPRRNGIKQHKRNSSAVPYLELPNVSFGSKDGQMGESSRCETITLESQRSKRARSEGNLPSSRVKLELPELNGGTHDQRPTNRRRKASITPEDKDRPYRCSKCLIRSNSQAYINKHVKKCHPSATLMRIFEGQLLYSESKNDGKTSREEDELKLTITETGENTNGTRAENVPEMDEVETAELDDANLTYVTAADGERYLSGSADVDKLKRFKCPMCPYRTSFKGDATSHRNRYHHRDAKEWKVRVLSKESAADTIEKYHVYEAMMKKKKSRRESRKDAVVYKRNVVEKLRDVSHQRPLVSPPVQDGNDQVERCMKCPYTAVRSGDLQTHMKGHIHNPSAKYVCKKCHFHVRTLRQLDMHEFLHLPKSEAKIMTIKRNFTLSWNVDRASVAAATIRRNLRGLRMGCRLCPFICRSKVELKKHRVYHSIDKEICQFKCEVCPYYTEKKEPMEIHLEMHLSFYYPRWIPDIELNNNMQGACVEVASVQGASVQGAGVQGAGVQGVRMEADSVQAASVQGASVQGASVQRASMQGAGLQGSSVAGACRCVFADQCDMADMKWSLYCGGKIQCPFCWYSVVSVGLMRQHLVFHGSIVNLHLSPLFCDRLDDADLYLDVPCCDKNIKIRHVESVTADPADEIPSVVLEQPDGGGMCPRFLQALGLVKTWK